MANTLKFGNGQWATKVGSTLAYNDENGNFKPLPFNFTRSTGATRVNKDGLIEVVTNNKPRIDFLNDSNGALLLEPSRTNLITYSEDFSNAYWSPNSNALISLSSNLSPDGTANAYRVEAVTGTQVGHVGTTTIGTTITHSIWVRRISGSTTFNMVDVNNITTSVNITSDWQRFSLTSTATSTVLRSYFKTTALGDVVEIYGAQAEVGSYATSYIPTQGATATRVAETCSQTPPVGVIGQTEGTVFADAANLFTSGNRTIALLYTNGSAFYQIYINASDEVRVDVNGSFIFLGGTIAANTQYKIAFAYKSGEYALYINGAQIATSVSTTMPSSLTEFYFGNSIGTEQSGAYNQATLYNTRLSNAELATLTSL
jgi:hypothetical protein